MSGRSYDVFLNDRLVGWLSESLDGRIGFKFADRYLALPVRPVLSQSFEDDLERTYWGKRAGTLPAFFDNLLPEGRLRSLLERTFSIPEQDDLALLAAVGKDLPGALSLVQSKESVLLNDTSEPLQEPASGAEGLRFSLAGVQLKFSPLRQGDRFTVPATSQRGDWIVKIGSPQYQGLAENEFTMLQWARHAGFDVPLCELCTPEQINVFADYIPEGVGVFAIRRYDRDGNRRFHQEDFAQVIGQVSEHKYDLTYEHLAVLIRGILGQAGYEELLRRLALVIATGNNDAHLKNWSLLYLDGVTPSLSPVYDQVCTIAFAGLDRDLALKLAGARTLGRVSVDSFRRLARKAGAAESHSVEVVMDALTKLRKSWSVVQQSPMFPSQIEALRSHWLRVPLLRASGELPS